MTWLIPFIITLAGAGLSHFICTRWKGKPRVVHLDSYEKVTAWILFCVIPSGAAWLAWYFWR